VASNVQFLDRGKDEGQAPQAQPQNDDFGEINLDDIPF